MLAKELLVFGVHAIATTISCISCVKYVKNDHKLKKIVQETKKNSHSD